MSIDQTMHSLFGASKVAADVLVHCFLEKKLGRGDLKSSPQMRETQLQVWHR